jgi:2-hydroxychromene-2-carboxylate isomerase
MRTVDWYFDFVSPYSYIALYRLKELPREVEVAYRPVLFAGLLNHFGQKGPAEISPKRQWTYRWCTWWAQKLGIPFRFPASHPFNPLPHLRLAMALNSQPAAVLTIFDDIWASGADATDPARFSRLCRGLQVDEATLGVPDVKEKLRKSTEDAASAGVFGVPSFAVDGEVFWGADSIEFLNAYLANPAVLENPEMQRVDRLPVGAARKT